MKRDAFLRALRKHAKAHGQVVQVNYGRGKGSHAMVVCGNRKTVVKDGELSEHYMKLVKKQLGIDEL